ncbi:HFL340Wp [Eremothecium sinecaudum]|uniref:HFL340Wp n=1 Tax=Eremothecium sinecaudum TaxID=45286 RepID=A0A0X8HU69_9SACH|nr:HFL340Wp [Eremothecium sinecaudum]AMD21516.1 HFL340Wp [Eremothecium sinecaudum]
MMFKTVTYTEEALLTDTDSDVEPCDLGHSNDRKNDISPKSEITNQPHLNASPSRDNRGRLNLPKFNRRPLSDTPIVSRWASPLSSTDSSTEGTPSASPNRSVTELGQLVEEDEEKDEEDDAVVQPVVSTGVKPSKRATTIDVPGLTRSKTSPDGIISKDDPGSKLVIVMVGMPAAGKSFITNKLSRFLNYSFYYCKVFNVGNTRREYAKTHEMSEQDSKFFDSRNPEANALRDKWAMDTLDELLDYLLDGPGSVAIFDATNSTKHRRKMICDKIRSRNSQLNVLFLESICTDKATVEKNIRLKLLGPDYKGKDPVASLRDFKDRLANYLKAYEPVEDSEDIQYIKMVDVGKKIISYNIQGFLASQTVYYLLNFNLAERQIWITRNGESESNILGRIGGDSKLTERGRKYAKALAKFIDAQRIKFNEQEYNQHKKHNDSDEEYVPNSFFVWTSMLGRSIDTAAHFNEDVYPIKQMRMLDELSAGDCEGMTYEEVHDKYPAEFEERLKDKLRYRYPGIGGESYMDVINRLRPVITEVERITDNVLIITHRVVARVLLGYFLNLSRDIIANLDIPLHSVYCLEPKPYGINWSLYEYDEEKDDFFMVPHTQLNTTKVKELGLVHNERRYSIVPTAPLSASADVIPRSKSDSVNTAMISTGIPSVATSVSSGGSSISQRGPPPLRHSIAYMTRPSKLARSKSDNLAKMSRNHTIKPPYGNSGIELSKLHEKLVGLQENGRALRKGSNMEDEDSHGYDDDDDEHDDSTNDDHDGTSDQVDNDQSKTTDDRDEKNANN